MVSRVPPVRVGMGGIGRAWLIILAGSAVLLTSRCGAQSATTRQAPITAAALAPGGQLAVAASQESIAVLAWPALQLTRQISWDAPAVHDLAFSPSGEWLAICGGAAGQFGSWAVYRWPECELAHAGRIGRDVLYNIDWDASQQWLAVAGGDRRAAILAWRDTKPSAAAAPPRLLNGHSKSVLCAAFLSESLVLTAGRDQTLRVWDWRSATLERSLHQHTGEVLDLAVAPTTDAQQRTIVASASVDRTVRFWQPDIGRMMRFCRLPSAPQAIAWTSDGARVLAACRDGRVRVIDPLSVLVLAEMPAVEGWAYCIAAADHGQALVGGEHGQCVGVRWER